MRVERLDLVNISIYTCHIKINYCEEGQKHSEDKNDRNYMSAYIPVERLWVSFDKKYLLFTFVMYSSFHNISTHKLIHSWLLSDARNWDKLFKTTDW